MGAPAGHAAGAAVCTKAGGTTQVRVARFGTNDAESSWVKLAGSVELCRFKADDEAKSRIYVDFSTLSSTQPTLAALAYLAHVPAPPVEGGANPATLYCTKLGGSSTFGTVGASGGGWVDTDDPDDKVVNLCVFPDLSFIDEWGLAYHSADVVRGKDLTTVMAYQPSGNLPPVFTTR